LVKRTYYKNRKPNKNQETIKQRLEDYMPEKCGPGRWQHDLTEEGVEPHPGPCHHNNRKQTDFVELSIWQLNIDSWKLRVGNFLREAERTNIDIFCLQEMKIQQGEKVPFATGRCCTSLSRKPTGAMDVKEVLPYL